MYVKALHRVRTVCRREWQNKTEEKEVHIYGYVLSMEALCSSSSYAVMDEEEMCYTEGGQKAVTTVATIVGTVITIYGATYAGGTVCGKDYIMLA
ncbi:MAG: hypothetical protein ACLTLY_03980 [Agathobacter rectalis]